MLKDKLTKIFNILVYKPKLKVKSPFYYLLFIIILQDYYKFKHFPTKVR